MEYLCTLKKLRNAMPWMKRASERACGTCGTSVQHWALLKSDGTQVAVATFCPVCYPDVVKYAVLTRDGVRKRKVGGWQTPKGGE